MKQNQNETRPFQLPNIDPGSLQGTALRFTRPIVERLLKLSTLNDLHEATLKMDPAKRYAERFLDVLNVQAIYNEEHLERIPKTGPLVVVANHPFGGVEGIALAHVLQQIRPDTKLLANEMLGLIPGFRDELFLVDVFNRPESRVNTMRALRNSMRWVDEGGCLGVFPAGEVSSLNLRKRHVCDAEWNPQIARIIQRTKATVVPVFFEGHNSSIFQIAGLIHPRLRSVMLPKEMIRRKNRRMRLRIGTPIPHERLQRFETPQSANDYLRVRTYMLHRERRDPQTRPPKIEQMQPVANPSPAELIQAELKHTALSLLTSGDFTVYAAPGKNIPHSLNEIGKLREEAFRAEGLGSGKPRDLDKYDQHYIQLVVYNHNDNQLVSGYRLGLTDQILPTLGRDGLYTHSLFRLGKRLLEQLGPSIELGRAWVSPKYQKQFSPLLLLWKGIAHYAALHPQYRNLIGAVSISPEYSPQSVMLLTQFLKEHAWLPSLGKLIDPVKPMRPLRLDRLDLRQFSTVVSDLNEVDQLVSELERDGKTMPVLLRQYLKLDGQLLGFNLDPAYGNNVDGLMRVDLCKVDPKILGRYMGKENLQSFLAYHDAKKTEQETP